MECAYCWQGNNPDAKACWSCGAPFPVANAKRPAPPERGQPFVYNGYVVWKLYEPQSRSTEFVFFLGRELVDRIRLSDGSIERFLRPGDDVMPLVWQLFSLARGQEDEVVVRSVIEPAAFKITRLDDHS